MRLRPAAAATAFAVALAGGLWTTLSEQPIHAVSPPAPPARRQLQCFAEGVLQRTEPRARVLFVVPSEHTDGRLIDHRLRYAVLGRQITTDPKAPADYVAAWMSSPPAGRRVLWRGCGGVLAR